MEGQYLQYALEPFIIAPEASVTLSSTSLLLHTMQYSSLRSNYWTPGRLLKLTVVGALTTAATPGNGTFEFRYGTASNAGTILATTAAVSLGASKTSITCILEAFIRCMTVGASGTFKAWARVIPDNTALVIPAAANPLLAPASAIASVTLDTNPASGLNWQLKRSGSTAETWVTHDVQMEVGA